MQSLTNIGILVGFPAIFFTLTFSILVTRRNKVKNSWSQIDVQLKKRHELIPNLIQSVEGSLEDEKPLLEKITEMHAQAMNAGSDIKTRAEVEGTLTSALHSLFAVTENSPDLKSNENMLSLQKELASTENNLSSARQFYNDSVTKYNLACEAFPASVIAGMFNYTKAEFFEL